MLRIRESLGSIRNHHYIFLMFPDGMPSQHILGIAAFCPKNISRFLKTENFFCKWNSFMGYSKKHCSIYNHFKHSLMDTTTTLIMTYQMTLLIITLFTMTVLIMTVLIMAFHNHLKPSLMNTRKTLVMTLLIK